MIYGTMGEKWVGVGCTKRHPFGPSPQQESNQTFLRPASELTTYCTNENPRPRTARATGQGRRGLRAPDRPPVTNCSLQVWRRFSPFSPFLLVLSSSLQASSSIGRSGNFAKDLPSASFERCFHVLLPAVKHRGGGDSSSLLALGLGRRRGVDSIRLDFLL